MFLLMNRLHESRPDRAAFVLVGDEMKEFARKFYQSKEWKQCRDTYIGERLLTDGGLCERCHEKTGAELHHIEHLSIFNIDNPHITLNPENLMWLCKDCHFEMHKESIMKGFRYKKKLKILSENGTWFDDTGRIHQQEVYIVWGSPASGKTTYINQHKFATDMTVDLDRIKSAIGESDNLLSTAFEIRDFVYGLIEKKKIDCKRIWIAATLPKRQQRKELQDRFHAKMIFIVKTYDECITNALKDDARTDKLFQEFIIKKWFEDYEA